MKINIQVQNGTPTLRSTYDSLKGMPENENTLFCANGLDIMVRRVGEDYEIDNTTYDCVRAVQRIRGDLRVENQRFTARPGDFGRDGKLTMSATRSILTMAQRHPTKTLEVWVNNGVIATVSGSGPFQVTASGEEPNVYEYVLASAAIRRSSEGAFESGVHRFECHQHLEFINGSKSGSNCVLVFPDGSEIHAYRLSPETSYEVYFSDTGVTEMMSGNVFEEVVARKVGTAPPLPLP